MAINRLMRSNRLSSVWDRRVDQWSETVDASPAFSAVRSRMFALAEPAEHDRTLDLGAGTGFLSLPLADQVRSVLAIDISAKMLGALQQKAKIAGRSIDVKASDMAALSLPDEAFDLIVSSYAMHYLNDADKTALLARIHHWLVPGGRLVISDMMFGRKLDQYHRALFTQKALRMLRRGPAGWWRLLKNCTRIATGKGRLRPCTPEWWVNAVTTAGFVDIVYEQGPSEAGIISARTQATPVKNSTVAHHPLAG